MIVTGLDLETTGLDVNKGHKILEICMGIRRDNGPAKWLVKKVNPMRSIDKAAEAIHGITLHSLRDAPQFKDIAASIIRILELTDLLVVHNAGFDVPFLAKELHDLGHKVPEVAVFCTMENGRSMTAMGKLPSLQELCFATGVPYDEDQAHGAQYDVQVMLDAFNKAVDMGRFVI